jgi:hypothetical protein
MPIEFLKIESKEKEIVGILENVSRISRQQMISFAEHCMLQLMTKEGEDGVGYIDGTDILKIQRILNQYRN